MLLQSIAFCFKLKFPSVPVVSYKFRLEFPDFLLLIITLDLNVAYAVHTMKIKPVCKLKEQRACILIKT